MASRPRSLPRKKIDENTVTSCYCRRCMKTKPIREFYTCTDKELDKNGYMSICKTCCGEIFDTSYTIEHNLEKALLRTCRVLNVAWIPSAVQAARTQLSKMMDKGNDSPSVFGIYKAKMSSFSSMNGDLPLTFSESMDNLPSLENNQNVTDDENFNKYLRDFWGSGLSFDDYEFLESELARYKKTHRCDTASELSLLRQICFAEYDIRKSRAAGGGGDAAGIKRLQELMKTASVDPAKTSAANSGKAQDTFSSFIKIIEENEPASYYGQDSKKLFKDFDNIDFYFKKYITRPLKNFILQSRDFNVDTEDDVDDIVDSEEVIND